MKKNPLGMERMKKKRKREMKKINAKIKKK